ncbi:MAG: DUF3168 domain-containing protein [Nitratireductor sp.]|nr:DUF3168 domain-containing protein [Nitratireductor sp.]
MSAALELQAAIVSALRQAPGLLTALGGPHIYDDVPDTRRPPYVQIGSVETLDWSTGTEEGEEHFVEIAAWSETNGRQAVALLAEAIRLALAALAGPLPGHALVNLSHEATRTEPVSGDRHFRAILSFRAVTEPLAP